MKFEISKRDQRTQGSAYPDLGAEVDGLSMSMAAIFDQIIKIVSITIFWKEVCWNVVRAARNR